MSKFRLGLIAVLLLFCVWRAGDAFLHRAVSQPPGVLAPEEPLQTAPATRAPIKQGKFTLFPLADYSITARILSRERYRFDRSAALSPLDFALGWGPMSDSTVLDRLDISQGSRWFWLHYSGAPPLSMGELTRHAANVHLIPADDIVRADLLRLRAGQLVTLEGQLISASSPEGFSWESSLSRHDTGEGSCEVFYVRKAFPRLASPRPK